MLLTLSSVITTDKTQAPSSKDKASMVGTVAQLWQEGWKAESMTGGCCVPASPHVWSDIQPCAGNLHSNGNDFSAPPREETQDFSE